ncbi:outer membrane beta-barrel family protein [Pedobacter sandarakinus]|uniref:outer membrane beta-barrel family protein n=1 Tax=Pedobacter sandarakinus TaxID=353156 RepID=UPI0022456E91|nr:outer membrane beta-barrel family protein [Pedobacter sandarakinus]MCX2576322.1 outer membrane beta-barrel family protein [Pedobacter sandarakinus]
MKQIFTFFFIIICSFNAIAQKTGSVSGRVIQSKDRQPIDYASVAIKNMADSTTVGAVSTEENGSFVFKGLKPGNYRLYAAFLGLKNTNKDFIISAEKLDIAIGDIVLEGGAIDLQTVEIKAEVPPIVVKKDTLEFNASSFKVVENAVVEDLLKKLPGVEVDKAGAVKAQGETITRIKVDGKEFFGNDPLLATKNLPADMIDKIQIIDELSDQAQFTGVDDGSRTKIINITTKKDRKHGYFGNSTAGYGSDDRYDINANINQFNQDRKLSVVAQFNNVNRQNFGGGLGGGNGGSNGGRGGITETNAGGFNFNDTYADETELSLNYFVNRSENLILRNSVTQNLLGDVTTIFNNNQINNSSRLNHRLNFMIDTKLDSLTSLRVQPNLSYTNNEGLNSSEYSRDYSTYMINGSQALTNHSTSPSINNNILLRRKFKRRGRTLSLNLNTSINNNDAANYNQNNETRTQGTAITPKNTNQFNDQASESLNQSTRLVYTEPLDKTLSLEFNYQNGYNHNKSDRFTYNFNPATLQYDLLDQTYSNAYENTILVNTAGFSFNKMAKKYNWNVGFAVQNTDRTNNNVTQGFVLKQNVFNYTPSAMFRYNFSNSKRFVINYRGSTNQPSIQQLQPIRNNTNTQNVPIGNPDLKPEFNNNLRLSFNTYTVGKNRSLFVNLNLTQTSNRIANSVSLIPTGPDQGKLAILPVNVNGVYSGSLNSSLSLPLMAENKLNFHVNVGANYDRDVNFTNSLRNITNGWSISNGYRLVSNLEQLDLTAGINGSINRATYSEQPNSNTRFYTFSPNISVSYLFPGNIRFAIDADYNQNTGRGEAFDTHFTLLNSYISKQLFNNRGTLKAAVNDLLNENQGVSRTANNNTIRDESYNVLKRYFMFSFTYSLNRMGGKNRIRRNEDGGGRNRGGGSGGGRQRN